MALAAVAQSWAVPFLPSKTLEASHLTFDWSFANDGSGLGDGDGDGLGDGSGLSDGDGDGEGDGLGAGSGLGDGDGEGEGEGLGDGLGLGEGNGGSVRSAPLMQSPGSLQLPLQEPTVTPTPLPWSHALH